ncbi:SDR family oxidoreductase [Rhizobium sp. CFBP 8762]|uniref:SDR family oxidoreductase n=1 Tax=Rhizobium sp. CFBP 8762 TaxID=2775279 RepID=UPI001785D5ED|nr:SDR family oxidoreductase [Rhizobium sp. CFBP 8762]MBD8556049.1 SDR family oxidoreductase [Rhizobium sp. CFBP 8762]
MLVFMTGASGFVGRAIVDTVRANGHDVLALAHSDKSKAALHAIGVRTIAGALGDEAVLERAAAEADAIIHTGFDHDFTRFRANCEQDQRVIKALTRGFGKGGPFVVTSAIGVLPRGETVDETFLPMAAEVNPRALTEETVRALRDDGARIDIVRLAPSVHGAGDPNFVATLVRIARERGVSAFIGKGDNRWPAVHRQDTAQLFATCLEIRSGLPALHAVAEPGIRFEEIARAIGDGLGLPTVSIAPETAGDHFAGFAHFAALDVNASANKTREAMAWTPRGPSLLQDIQAGRYFG